MNINWPRMSEAEKGRRTKQARKHLRPCVGICGEQIKEGRYFLHEHPGQASSWQEPMVKKMIKKAANILSWADQCQYGLWAKDKMGKALAKKPTKFMINSPYIAEQLQRRCDGIPTHEGGRHGGRI